MGENNNFTVIIVVMIGSALVLATSSLGKLFCKRKKAEYEYSIVEKKKKLYKQNQERIERMDSGLAEDDKISDFKEFSEIVKNPEVMNEIKEYKQKMLSDFLCDNDFGCALMKAKMQTLDTMYTVFEISSSVSGTVFIGAVAFYCTTISQNPQRPGAGGEARETLPERNQISEEEKEWIWDNNGGITLDERFRHMSDLRVVLEQKIISSMSTNNRGDESEFLQKLDSIFSKAEITQSEREQIYMAALNLNLYKDGDINNLVLEESKMSNTAKELAVYVRRKGQLSVPKGYNSIFDAYKGTPHFARK